MEKRQTSLRASRISISSLFFFFGFIFASWASRIPAIQQQLHLSDAGLGAVLLSMPVGSFIALPFSGYLSSKFGSRIVAIISSFIYSCLLIVIGFSGNIFQLTVCLFLFGAAGNIVNIAINTQALALEKLYNRTIISSFHGMWSVAGLVAASLGTYFIARSFPVPYHFLVIAIISLTSFLICSPYLIYENAEAY
ncbi:MAG: MFS transporter, partial [Ginsengibacter sp.]